MNRACRPTRGGTDGHLHVHADGIAKERLQDPARLPAATSGSTRRWDDALAIYCGLTKKILDNDGPSGLVFNCFDHGGAGGGFENTWGTGKLMFSALQTPMVRIHNRPAYNSECHATRDMGVGELNNSYEDAELADCIVGDRRATPTRPRPTTSSPLDAEPAGRHGGQEEEVVPRRDAPPRRKVIFVDPRRTATVAIAEQIAGKDNVLHLDIEPGTDIALFNGAVHLRRRAGLDRQGLHRQAHRRLRRRGEGQPHVARRVQPHHRHPGRQAPAGRGVGLQAQGLRSLPAHHARLREGHHLGQRQLPHPVARWSTWCSPPTTSAGAAPACVRMGGHQEGYTRPPYPGDSKIYIDEELIKGKGKMLTAWGCNNFQTTLNAQAHRAEIAPPRQHREGGDEQGARRDARADGRRDLRRLQQGRAVRGQHRPLSDHVLRGSRTCCCRPRTRAR